MFNKTIVNLAEKIINYDDFEIEEDQALELAALGPEETMDLITCADKIRRRYHNNRVFKCTIINAKSGRCSQDCAFCAQSAHHTTPVDTYELVSAEKIVEAGLAMKAAGGTQFSVVTSGLALNDADVDTVCRAVATLKDQTDLTLCASVGILSDSAAQALKAAGIERYHHNLETAASYFDQICTTHDYADDLKTVAAAKASGMNVCSGGILGMGESWEQRVELAYTLRSLDVDSIPINFLNPLPGTKLEDRPLMAPMEALKCVALFRFIHPRRDIPICGGREVTLGDFQSWLFMAGANGLMMGNYLTTQGRNYQMDLDMIKELGLSDGTVK